MVGITHTYLTAGPFQVIHVGAAAPSIPARLVDQVSLLKPAKRSSRAPDACLSRLAKRRKVWRV